MIIMKMNASPKIKVMKFQTGFIAMAITAAVFSLASCNKMDSKPTSSSTASTQQSLQEKMAENGTNADEAIFSKAAVSNTPNHFYIESNKSGTNTVLVFLQDKNGRLVLKDEVASGGNGLGAGLGSQGALAVSEEYNLLFAVNAASNSVSSFRISKGGGLQLLYTATSTGQLPNSITVHGNLLYLLNKTSSSVCGFTFTPNGFLSPIEGSTHNLSGMNVDAPEIKFQPDGAALYITEKATNIIDKFELDSHGAITAGMQIPSKGVTPFSFDYARNNKYMIVTNAAAGASGAGSCTSYKFSSSQGLADVNGAVSNYETSPCWVATTKFGSFAFVANTSSNNISSYYIDKNGALTLISAVAAADGEKPIDIAVSTDNRYVYNIYSGTHNIVAYERMSAGVIKYVDEITTLPDYAAGLAVR